MLHLKHHQILILLWILPFLAISGNIGKEFGSHSVFLDPEYLGEVSILSFYLVGLALGGFLITWNITTYVLNSHRFPFMATMVRPYAMFSLNNSVIPIVFLIGYGLYIFQFQLNNEFKAYEYASLYVIGIGLGVLTVLLLSAVYFYLTNKNVFQILGYRIPGNAVKKLTKTKNDKWEELEDTEDGWRVDYFLTSTFKIRHTRNTDHYDDDILKRIFKQHHFNALIIQLVSIVLLVSLGIMIDYEGFRVPAAASIFLMLALLMSLSGVFTFWVGKWKTVLLILIILGLNELSKYDLYVYDNQAYGLDYTTEPAEYSMDKLKELSSYDNIRNDIQHTENILDNWKAKQNGDKPKMIIVSVSGGGSSSAMFTTRILQKADSTLADGLFDKISLITGASGGMFGAAYIRELFLQQQKGNIENLYDVNYAYDVANDLLTPIIFTLVVNDLFYLWQKFEWGGQTYLKDRATIFEEQFLRHTHGILEKHLDDYLEVEKAGIIPQMIFTPTIINDGRKLIISPQPSSHLMRPVLGRGQVDNFVVDGVDFKRMYESQGAGNLRFMSAIRMNGTYPYILPSVTLPSEPITEVMDAGFRDNFGLQLCMRYVHAMRSWINDNTSGVIILQIRAFRHEDDFGDFERPTILSRLFTPVGNLFANLSKEHDYNNAYMYQFMRDQLDVPMNLVTFNYIPGKKEERAALSYRLTTKEKFDILESAQNLENQQALNRLQELLKR